MRMTRESQGSKATLAKRFKEIADKHGIVTPTTKGLQTQLDDLEFDGDNDINDVFQDALPRRNNRENRRRLQANWHSIKPALVQALMRQDGVSEQGCTGNCYPVSEDVYLFSAVTCVRERVSFCCCAGREKAPQLLAMGYFPSTPINPSIGFALGLLELFNHVLLEGPVSKRAFAFGLRKYHQKKTAMVLPDICTSFNNAYSHWLDATHTAQRIL